MRPLALFGLLFLLNCTGRAPELSDISSESSAVSSEAPRVEVPQEEESVQGSSSSESKEGKGRYFEDYYAPNGAEALASAVLGNGESSLLFFYAAGCASCASADVLLKALYSTDAFPLSSYKIDFAASQDLQARFGVTAEGTLVLIDGEGRALQAIPRASEMDLRYLLQR